MKPSAREVVDKLEELCDSECSYDTHRLDKLAAMRDALVALLEAGAHYHQWMLACGYENVVSRCQEYDKALAAVERAMGER